MFLERERSREGRGTRRREDTADTGAAAAGPASTEDGRTAGGFAHEDVSATSPKGKGRGAPAIMYRRSSFLSGNASDSAFHFNRVSTSSSDGHEDEVKY